MVYACGATSISGPASALSVGANTPCPMTVGFRRDFHPDSGFLRALSGSIMPASYRRISAARALCRRLCRFYFRFVGLVVLRDCLGVYSRRQVS